MRESENKTLGPDPASIETGVAPDSLEADLRELAHAPPVVPATVLRTGDVISERFELMDRLGAGGMGVVYLAHDRTLDRPVAIKFHTADANEEAQARLLREAQAMAKVTHANVITVHEVGEFKGQVYIAMEYLDGGTVREVAADKDAPEERIVELFLAAGRGLAAAHAAGLVHRDFKPDNILLGTDGRVRVADFGLARGTGVPLPPSVFEETVDGSAIPRAVSGSGSLPSITRTGKLLGTPAYMAPEQFFHGEVDGRADQYAFCVALHEALTGKRPFGGVASYQRRKGDEVVTHAKMSRSVRRVVTRGLARQPADRYPSMDQLLTALDPADRRRRRRLFAAGGAGMAVAAVGISLAQGPSADAAPAGEECPAMESAYDELVPPPVVDRFLGRVEELDPAAHSHVARRLDEQRTLWADVAQNACRQARVTGAASETLLDRKTACLEREAGLIALKLEAASRDDVTSLGSFMFDESLQIGDCGRTDVVNSPRYTRDSPGDDPETVEAVRSRLSKLSVEREVADGPAALEELVELERQTRELETPQLKAEASLHVGQAYTDRDQYDKALPYLEEAYRYARMAEDTDSAVNAARFLSLVYGYYLDDMGLGRAWSTVAMAEANDPVVSTRVAAAALITAGLLEEIAGNFEESLLVRQRAEDLLKSRGVPNADSVFLKVRADLAVSFELLGRFDEAEATYKEVLELREELYPPNSSRTLSVRNNYGMMLYQSGRGVEAVPIFEMIIEQTDCDRDPLACATTQINLGISLIEAEEYERAGETLDESERSLLELGGPDHRDMSLVYEAQGQLATQQHDYDKALAYLEKSVAVNLKLDGRDDPDLGRRFQQRAYILGKQGKYDEALESLEQATQQLAKGYRPEHTVFVSLSFTRASILHEAGETEAALELLRTVEAEATSERDAVEARDMIAKFEDAAKK